MSDLIDMKQLIEKISEAERRLVERPHIHLSFNDPELDNDPDCQAYLRECERILNEKAEVVRTVDGFEVKMKEGNG